MSQPDLSGVPQSRRQRPPRPVKCAACGGEVDRDEVSHGDRGTSYYRKPMHQGCYYGDYPEATLRVYFPHEGDEPGEEGQSGFDRFEIGGGRNETATEQYGEGIGLWRTSFARTDAWRGYYSVVPPRGWVRVHEDCALSGSEDSSQLMDFDKALRRVCQRMKIVLVRAVCRTSNVFSAGVDYYVRRRQERLMREVVEHLREVYRDPERFRITALTGKDPRDFTGADKIIGAIGTILFPKEGRDAKDQA